MKLVRFTAAAIFLVLALLTAAGVGASFTSSAPA
jgi:hypothetical protein